MELEAMLSECSGLWLPVPSPPLLSLCDGSWGCLSYRAGEGRARVAGSNTGTPFALPSSFQIASSICSHLILAAIL